MESNSQTPSYQKYQQMVQANRAEQQSQAQEMIRQTGADTASQQMQQIFQQFQQVQSQLQQAQNQLEMQMAAQQRQLKQTEQLLASTVQQMQTAQQKNASQGYLQ